MEAIDPNDLQNQCQLELPKTTMVLMDKTTGLVIETYTFKQVMMSLEEFQATKDRSNE